MKNKTFTKIFLMIFSLALIAGALFAMTAGAEDATKPEIFSQNVEYNDKFSLMYAIKADTVTGDSVTLNLYDEEPAEGVDPIATYTSKTVTTAADSGAAYDAYIITTDGVSALALDRVFYVQAIDANGVASDVKTYSVVEYLYTRLADVDGKANTDTQNNLYKSVITFGTCAQQQFLTAEELAATTLISDYCYVSTYGCTVEGKETAVVPQNKAFTVYSADGALAGCTVTTYDTYDTTGNATETAVTGSSVTITGSNRADIVAGTPKTYKEGTETFESLSLGNLPFSGYYAEMEESKAKFQITRSADATNGGVTIASDNVYGKNSNVLKFIYSVDDNASGVDLCFFPTQGTVERTEADELELSFDFKLDESANSIYTMNFFKTGKSTYVKFGVEDGKLVISNSKNSNVISTDANPYEWNNIRIVVKDFYSTAYSKMVPELYIYVNNDTETATGTFRFNNSDMFSMIDEIESIKTRFEDYEIGAAHTIYFDNVWCGFNNVTESTTD